MQNNVKSSTSDDSYNFYKNLKSFTDYNNLFQQEHYIKVPDDWFILASDVVNSTEAIKNGKYRDVNMVGALSISAILNCVKDELPFTFGGDGSMILVPPSKIEECSIAHRQVAYIAKQNYGLDLRVAIIPVKDVHSLDKDAYLEVAKYQLSAGHYTAQFKGLGLAIIDRMLKHQLLNDYWVSPLEGMPNLDGLSCRWAPIKNTKGTIASIIINSATESVVKNSILNIEKILGRRLKESAPLSENTLNPAWPPRIDLETKANLTDSNKYKRTYFKYLLINALAYIVTKLNLTIGNFSTTEYKKSVVTNADFKKYDDSLKMVIDCSLLEASKIKEYLFQEYALKKMKCGIHLSENAIMTCYVQSTKSQHFHFIDGEGGGYTRAASDIKEQFRREVESIRGQSAS